MVTKKELRLIDDFLDDMAFILHKKIGSKQTKELHFAYLDLRKRLNHVIKCDCKYCKQIKGDLK